MTKITYPSELKATVLAALLEGQSINFVAKKYKIPTGTIKSWKSRQNGEPIAKVATQKKEEIGNLLIEYLHTNLVTLKEQSKVFSDVSWLKKQGASELAVLHGVIADKTIRLLEALANQDETEPD